MNIFNKVAFESLKKNKTRTVVTIIGIILSASMICAVTTFASSFQNFLIKNTIYTEGDWHGSAIDTQWDSYNKIVSSKEVSSAVFAQHIGYAQPATSINEYKPYVYVLGTSENFENTMPVHIISGRYPLNQTEILLPEHLYSNGGIQYKLGETLSLSLGERILNGSSLTQNTPCFYYDASGLGGAILNPETIKINETRSYTVVGFYERPAFEAYTAPGYTVLTVADNDLASEKSLLDVYFKLQTPSKIYSFMEENNITGAYNADLLMFSGITEFNTFNAMFTGLCVIVILLIMFGSVSLIYNAFSISVSERTKQFGLLSSIGATKRQLRKVVFFEALSVSLIGIPIGIFAGIAGIAVTLFFVGSKFSTLGNYHIPMEISVSPLSIIAALLVSLVTVLISAWIPSKRCTKISAVEAIRQNSDISDSEKAVKTSKLTYKLFGLPGMLADKHYKRSRKKYRTTVLSLFMSIVLFVSASAFSNYLMESISSGFSTDGYDLEYTCNETAFSEMTPKEILELIKSIGSVTDAAFVQTEFVDMIFDKSNVSKDYFTQYNNYSEEQGSENVSTVSVPGYISFVNDEQFKVLLKKYNLDEALYMNPDSPLAITFDENVYFNTSNKKLTSIKLLKEGSYTAKFKFPKSIEGYSFDTELYDENGNSICRYYSNENPEEVMDIPLEEAYTENTFVSGKTLYEKPFFVTSKKIAITLLYPQSLKTAVIEGNYTDRILYDYRILSSNHRASYSDLQEKFVEKGIYSGNIIDYAESAETNRNLITVVKVFAYGFIVLISLISAANVFNTISTNISLRRREFAMLKSVGMTEKGFNKMMNFECLLYGSRALILGIPVSVAVTFLIFLAVNSGFSTNFTLPWAAIAIAILSVFAVVFTTMLYSMKKIKKDNPIDALKNENL